MSETILHPDLFTNAPFLGDYAMDLIQTEAQAVEASTVLQGTENEAKTPVSIIVRTKQDGHLMERFIDDIENQAYAGEVELVVVDTESDDSTIPMLKAYGATIVSIAQKDFTYPSSLNKGVEAAAYDNIFMTVGHANLSNNQTVRAVAQTLSGDVAGAYGPVLPGYGASRPERYLGWTVRTHLQKAEAIKKYKFGMFGATNAAISKEVWEELGGFDERFAAGGEDGDMAKRIFDAGYKLGRSPLLAVHHSHGLGLINSYRQVRHWQDIKNPLDFDAAKIAARRPDMRERLEQQ